jgi:hypothetical protein
VDNPNYQAPTPASNEITINDSDNLGTKAVKAVGGTLEGIGEGVFGTINGAAKLAGIHSDELSKLAGEDQDHGGAQSLGRGIEQIGEFVMGDEALKGLSFADKLAKWAPIAKHLEQFPRLAKALQLGINVGKAGAELTPEDRAALKASPVLARLVGAGYDAIRAGVTQAAQTEVKTGGDTGQALKEGLGMAAGAGITGGVLGTAGGLLSKGADAADTIGELGNQAQSAPTGAGLTDQLKTQVNDTAGTAVTNAQDQLTEAQDQLDKVGQFVQSAGANAPENQELIEAAQKAAQSAKAQLGTEFNNAGQALIKAAGDANIPLENSPLQNAAKTLTQAGTTEAKPLDEAFSKTRPGSVEANNRLDLIINPYKKETEAAEDEAAAQAKKTPVAGAAPAATPAADALAKLKAKPINLNMSELLERRKQLNELLRNTGWQSDEQRADQDIYRKLIGGVDDSIEQLVTKSGNPEALHTLESMNSNYKTGIQRFENPDVKALLEGRVSGNDLVKKLTSGVTGKGDVQAVHSAIGDKAFQKLAEGGLGRMASDAVDKQTGEFSLRNFLTKWNGLNPEARDEMFKDSLGAGMLKKAVETAQTANSSMPELTKNLKDATDTVSRLIGNGDVGTLLKDPERVKSLAASLGPDGMHELGTSILQNQLREAATNAAGKVRTPDTGKVLKFIASLKDSPEVVQSLFRPTPEASQAYDKLLGQLQNVQSVKNAVKAGVIAPTLAAGASFGPISAIAAGLLTAGEVGTHAGRELLEKVANNPTTWNALTNLSKATSTPLAKTVGRSIQYGAGKAGGAIVKDFYPKQNVYSGAQEALGGK